jgi:cytochrome c-type biogenesis protein CcmH
MSNVASCWRLSRSLAIAAALFTGVAITGIARAVEPGEMLTDPALEARARAISAGLRCLVCQNQSIDDSNAPLAHDLRVIVRERLLAGDNDAAVRAYVVNRFGEFVLLKPPLSAGTLLLWLTPVLLLAAAGGLASRQFLRRSGAAAHGEPPPLSADEQRRLAEHLKDPE